MAAVTADGDLQRVDAPGSGCNRVRVEAPLLTDADAQRAAERMTPGCCVAWSSQALRGSATIARPERDVWPQFRGTSSWGAVMFAGVHYMPGRASGVRWARSDGELHIWNIHNYGLMVDSVWITEAAVRHDLE